MIYIQAMKAKYLRKSYDCSYARYYVEISIHPHFYDRNAATNVDFLCSFKLLKDLI